MKDNDVTVTHEGKTTAFNKAHANSYADRAPALLREAGFSNVDLF
jgi:hypothetical protein